MSTTTKSSITADDIYVGNHITVPTWKGNGDGWHEGHTLKNFSGRIIHVYECSFMVEIDPGEIDRNTKIDTCGRVVVSMKSVGVRPRDVKERAFCGIGRSLSVMTAIDAAEIAAREGHKLADNSKRRKDLRTGTTTESRRLGYRKRRDAMAPTVEKLYAEGLSRTEVAQQMNCSSNTLVKIETENGLKELEVFSAKRVLPDGSFKYYRNTEEAIRNGYKPKSTWRDRSNGKDGSHIEYGMYRQGAHGWHECKKGQRHDKKEEQA
ncbi:hypothetical protein [Lacticaseibacillus kribbianus]|uniref:hypothetical protein n=1 Tax=Lacticaseibacillus kribbianus TaxID=2926292 RepID=UPI001CD19A60|nr:hypothetical protein [Lacticaseibacillus kribbianus]